MGGGSPKLMAYMEHSSERQLGAHQRGHATTSFLGGFSEGSLKEVLLRRVLRRQLVLPGLFGHFLFFAFVGICSCMHLYVYM